MSSLSADHGQQPPFYPRLFRKRVLQDRIAVLEREGDALREVTQDHARTVLAREATILECEAVVLAREQTVAGLERECDALRALMYEHAGTVVAREATIVACEGEVHAREQTIAGLEREGEALRDMINEHARTVLAREATIVECEGVVRAREQTIAGYEENIRRCEAMIAGLEAAAQEREQVIVALSGANAGAMDGDLSGHMPAALQSHHDALSSSEANRYIRAWKGISTRFSNSVLSGGQTLIEPYLLERTIHDRLGRLIIATVEGQQWYDNNNGIELPQLLRLGMIRQGDTVFDCGANPQVNSLFYSRAVGASGRVFAFDPFPLNIEIGHFNARMNGADNIEFIRAGLSDQAGRIVVSLAEQCVGTVNETAADAVPISLAALDTFAALRPSFLKIDIEGAEVNALEGAHEVLAQEPAIYIEVHPNYLPRFGRSPLEIFKHVDLERYNCYINYPRIAPLTPYHGEFDMTEGCALFFVPKSRVSLTRHFGPAPASA